MVTGGPFPSAHVTDFFIFTVAHAIIDTALRQLNFHIMLQNRFVIRRMVMQKLLFSEIWAFENIKTSDLETKISADISQTMSLFNNHIPSIFGNLYALTVEGQDLYAARDQVDLLAVLRPTLLGLLNRAVSWFQFSYFERQEMQQQKANASNMSRFVQTSLDGLGEIQINNLQQAQLDLLDRMIDDELETNGVRALFTKTWNTINNRNLLDFVSEVFVVHTVMQRRNISHEQYRKIQNDVDHVLNLGFKMFRLIRLSWNILAQQGRVVALLTLPNFKEETQSLRNDITTFESLRVDSLSFSYRPGLPPALNLDSPIEFLPGKIYGLVGQNRSGKSTLLNLLCKLYAATPGCVKLNGVAYEHISRQCIRSLLAYVAQRPFIFPGTIRENIMVGNPEASEAEVFEAAHNAGVFLYGVASTLAPPADHTASSSTTAGQGATGAAGAALRRRQGTTRGRYCAKHREFCVLESVVRSNVVQYDRCTGNLVNGCVVCTRGGAGLEKRFERDKEALRIDSDRTEEWRAILDMELTARGTNISGGFAQSVALARVFLRKNAKIFILDEAMGQMDAFKKREVIMPRLFEFVRQRGLTLILVSHDLSVMQDVDWIYLLDAARLVHQGSHHQLVEERAPVYMKLLGS
eukprot:TRINITY_DN1126_c0_g1_i1.p1 TRINITY_DN1126_c0_g1~~TRINITY_DN1126_c0_g1_i1.p1  ORF type:complete len:746 (-),score=163.21 TRINITY_DN1126_c0_g1_i1:20-1927(-)